jgi:exonuclease SbcC
MSIRLTSLVVEDFRSIRGTVNVSLDAQVVLIHGPNGTGKTSLLSAIELGLTSAVGSIARMDNEYLKHLPHKASANGTGRVWIKADGLPGAGETELVVDGEKVIGQALLEPDTSRIFTERCYLAQSTLGRLLEIYERQDTRRSDSALTRFVKELLGLEALDALIDGLHDAGDVRRLREPAPLFWAARNDAQPIARDRSDAEAAAASLRTAIADEEADLRSLLGDLVRPNAMIDPESLTPQLTARLQEQEQRLLGLARQRRDLEAASGQVMEAAAAADAGERIAAEQASAAAHGALEAWLRESGAGLEIVINAVQGRFGDVPPMTSAPDAAHAAASKAVGAEKVRLQALLDADAADGRASAEVEESVRQGEARIATIDRELAADTGASNELAQALTAIAEHIHGDECPVCGRDFSEVSETPLAAHVSEEVGRLIAAVGRVQALIRDRTTTTSAVAQARRRAADVASRRLPAERADTLRLELASLTEWLNSLDILADAAATGAQLLAASADTAQTLAALTSRESAVGGLRSQLTLYARQLGIAAPASDADLGSIVSFLLAEVDKLEATLSSAQATYTRAVASLDELTRLRTELAEAVDRFETADRRDKDLTARRSEADRRVAMARDLAARAQALRTAKVRQVFNDELNNLWRELFIRLAPDEAFVPAFALPPSTTGPVEAMLETNYRSGGKGGNPRAMLSAGNLNTAALTLFLALHLSVKPVLPWLIIDDPVQSMDDVHIAQFAALLRTLKREGRQVILAVHDRQLFDYLALELSPAFNGDRLITIELGRNADGLTTAPWIPTVFEPDKAIAA